MRPDLAAPAPRERGTGSPAEARILYIIASHNQPQQVLRLVRAVTRGDPQARVVVHHNPSRFRLPVQDFEAIPGVHVMRETVAVRWGDFSQVDLFLKPSRWALDHLDFDWVMLLTGQDYPVTAPLQIREFLAQTLYDGFLRGYLADPRVWPPNYMGEKEALRRYWFRYYDLPSNPYYYKLPKKIQTALDRCRRWLNDAQSLIQVRTGPGKNNTRLGIRALSSPFGPGFACYVGSDWPTLSRRCLEYLHEFAENNPKTMAYYRRTALPSEGFYQTVLFNQPKFNILRDTFRFERWEDNLPYGGARPMILRSTDLDMIVQSGAHFARKFDIDVDSEILDRLDAHLSGTLPTA